MESVMAGLVGSVGSVAVFGFLSFVVWLNYRKEKDEREATREQRMKALELGYAPPDAEIARARAYASAAWAAGVIGLVVPIVVVVLTVAATIVAVLNHAPYESIAGPLIVAWSIAGVIVLATVWRTLGTIRQLPRPAGDLPQRPSPREKRADSSSAEFQEKHLEL
jgi:hypothetical protein